MCFKIRVGLGSAQKKRWVSRVMQYVATHSPFPNKSHIVESHDIDIEYLEISGRLANNIK